MPCNTFKSDKEGYKICSVCKQEKPATLEYFKDAKGGLYGVQARCKECDKIYRKENKEHIQQYSKQKYIADRDKRVIESHKRNSVIKNVVCDFTVEDWEKCLEYFNNSCAYCGISGVMLQQEHLVPVSDGGTYTKNNIIPACFHCNTNKRAREVIEWYPKQEFFDPKKFYNILVYLELITKKP
jgi:5-methylcytosine-specific restriction endonuclease McrA